MNYEKKITDQYIRKYNQSDEEAVVSILKEPNGHYMTSNQLDLNGFQEIYVYEVENNILGLLCLEVHECLSQIICYVAPSCRRKGIGSILFNYGKERLSRLDPNTIWIFFRNDLGDASLFYRNRGAKPWYCYHQMIFENASIDYKINDSFQFDQIIQYESQYFEEYLESRSSAFLSINQLINSKPYDEKNRRNEIKDWAEKNKDDIWLFFKDNQIVGSLALYQGFIDELFVIPSYQGKGIGKSIVSWALDKCNYSGWKPLLCVVTENKPAINLYQSMGFKISMTLEMNRIFSENKEPDLRGPIGG